MCISLVHQTSTTQIAGVGVAIVANWQESAAHRAMLYTCRTCADMATSICHGIKVQTLSLFMMPVTIILDGASEFTSFQVHTESTANGSKL